ncbi:UNVERIFIED_CONTAM: hypothetical protein RMT77_013014 [Armadillidium vulgare]
MTGRKKDARIPLHIVDYHNDALSFILRSIGSKKLNFNDNLLIHFDSHPDLLVEDQLKKSHIYDPEALYEKVNIETWVLPMVFAGHVSEIVWIKPKWSTQIDDGRYEFHVGETVDNGIKISGPLLYFISGLAYAPYEKLNEPSKLTLHVITWSPSKEDIINTQSLVLQLIKNHNESYILDIDLDFFYTLNPFIEMYKNANMYDHLKHIYKFTSKDLASFSSPESAQHKRREFIEKMETFFRYLEENAENSSIVSNLDCKLEGIEDEKIVGHIKTLIKELFNSYSNEVDWAMVHIAGSTIDDETREVPHHPSSNDEMDQYINHFKMFLNEIYKPKIITIARSSQDDYCPSHIADMLQERIVKIIFDSFTEVTIHNNYEQAIQ